MDEFRAGAGGRQERKTEERDSYQQIYDSIETGIFHVRGDSFMTIVRSNRAAYKILGYTKEEFVRRYGKNLIFCVHEPDLAHDRSTMRSLYVYGESIGIECRVVTGYGELKWLHLFLRKTKDNCGSEIYQIEFQECHDMKTSMLELERESEMFRTALRSTEDIVFEYDIDLDCISMYGPANDEKGVVTYGSSDDSKGTSVTKDYIKNIKSGRIVPPEYMDLLISFLLGEKEEPIELEKYTYVKGERIRQWVRSTCVYIPIEGKKGKTVGTISDFQFEKERERMLSIETQCDVLTELYSRSAALERVESVMNKFEHENKGALFLISMDDFQRVNEMYGYSNGDLLLFEMAEMIKDVAGSESIVFRFSGDEFGIYFFNVSREDCSWYAKTITERCSTLNAAIRLDIDLSCSTAIVLQEKRYSFNDMLDRAVKLVKNLKRLGKRYFSFYYEAAPSSVSDEENFAAIDKDRDIFIYEIVSYAHSLLENSSNIKTSVTQLINRIGHMFMLDNIAIMLFDTDNLCFEIPFVWSQLDETPSDIIGERYMSREDCEALERIFSFREKEQRFIKMNENQIPPYLYEILFSAIGAIPAKSIFYPYFLDGRIVGVVSYHKIGLEDDFEAWSSDEVKIYEELSMVISIYLQKEKADNASRAKTVFLSKMSHEIRTPMNAIMGMTKIALDNLDNRSRVEDCLKKISDSSSFLLDIINDILNMSRIESGRMELYEEDFSIRELEEKLYAIHATAASMKGLTFITDFDVQNEFYKCDKMKLNQVLTNLIGNSLKFTPVGGKISVTAKSVRVNHDEENGIDREYVCFTVTDTGIGIDPSNRNKIFGMFEQANSYISNKYGGTGLGLPISSGIVRLMGGNIEVESAEGQGSKFYFTVPMTIGKSPEKHEEIEKAKDIGVLKGKRILVVEDNELNSEIAGIMLQNIGMEPEFAFDGQQALEAYRKHGVYYYDAVLMDIRMPVMDGIEATRHIRNSRRKDSKTIPIIATTANAFDEDTRQILNSGMNFHVPKPIDMKLLIDVLYDCLAEKK